MEINFKHIAEGIANRIIVKEEVEKIALQREDICAACPHNSKEAEIKGLSLLRPDYHCTICFCNIRTKSRSLSSECPEGKWEAAATEEQDALVDKFLEDSFHTEVKDVLEKENSLKGHKNLKEQRKSEDEK